MEGGLVLGEAAGATDELVTRPGGRACLRPDNAAEKTRSRDYGC